MPSSSRVRRSGVSIPTSSEEPVIQLALEYLIGIVEVSIPTSSEEPVILRKVGKGHDTRIVSIPTSSEEPVILGHITGCKRPGLGFNPHQLRRAGDTMVYSISKLAGLEFQSPPAPKSR